MSETNESAEPQDWIDEFAREAELVAGGMRRMKRIAGNRLSKFSFTKNGGGVVDFKADVALRDLSSDEAEALLGEISNRMKGAQEIRIRSIQPGMK